MNASHRPRVTIGLPVFNGEDFIEATLESLCAQEFTDFELLIADNHSTDATARICERFLARDDRIRFHPSERNLGAAWNFNRLIPLAEGEFFMWAAHDDVFAPSFVRRAVEVLDADPEAVLACVGLVYIDADGERISDMVLTGPSPSSDPVQRFRLAVNEPKWNQIFGLMRLDVLRAVREMGAYAGADEVLLCDLSLRGRFLEIPEPLFFHREHGTSSTEGRNLAQRGVWFDPSRSATRAFPRWRIGRELFGAALASPLDAAQRRAALLVACRWFWDRRRSLVLEAAVVTRRLLRTRARGPSAS